MSEERGLSVPRGNSGGGAVIGLAAEQQRAIAEVQAALTVAKHNLRDEVDCMERIRTACQRIGIAEKAEYCYQRGGTEIQGPTIDLLTVIAGHWRNIEFGFRELLRGNGESTVEAYSWDLETNVKRKVVFTVPHERHTRSGVTPLTDPRDIYEAVSNVAQRRVRACLEAVIPPDVIEDAVAECRRTLETKAEVTSESIKKLLEAFGELGITREQLETRLGRKVETMQPAQLVNMRRIYKSIQDGISQPGDWFKVAANQESDLNEKVAAKSAAPSTSGKKAASTPAPAEERRSAPPTEASREPEPPGGGSDEPETFEDEEAPPRKPYLEKSAGAMTEFLDLADNCKTARDWERLGERFVGPKAKVAVTEEEAREISAMVRAKCQELLGGKRPAKQQTLA